MKSMMKPYEVPLFKIHSANVLGARKPNLALRDTTDYPSKFVMSPASRWLSSYAREGLRKEGLPLYRLLTRGCARICVCAF